MIKIIVIEIIECFGHVERRTNEDVVKKTVEIRQEGNLGGVG